MKIGMIYKGANSDNLRLSEFSDGEWTGNRMIGQMSGDISPHSEHTPGAALFKKQLRISYKGTRDEDLFIAQFDGIEWAGDQRISKQPNSDISPKSTDGPAMVVYGDQLHIVYKGKGNNYLYHAYFDGTTWAGDDRIEVTGSDIDPGTNHGVDLAVFDGKIYTVYKGAHDDDIRWMAYDGLVWRGDQKIRDMTEDKIVPKTSGSNPGLVVYDELLYIFYKGCEDNRDIFYATFDKTTWAGNTKISGSISPETSKCPRGFVDKNEAGEDVLRIVYKGANSDSLYMATLADGSWSGNHWIEALNSDGVVEPVKSDQTPSFADMPIPSAKGSADWMTTYNATLGSRTFAQITLPSSHDSGMHIARGTAEKMSTIGRGTRTHELDIYSQIVFGGARVLDLRPVYYEASVASKVGSGYYMGHYAYLVGKMWEGLVGEDLAGVCQDLEWALRDLADKEVLVITVSHGAYLKEGGLAETLSEERQAEVIAKLLEACGTNLYKATGSEAVDFFALTPDGMTKSGTSAFLVLADDSFKNCKKTPQDGCFQSTSFETNSTWGSANTDSQYAFFKDTEKALRNYDGGAGKLWLAWQLTWKPFESKSLKDFAKEINHQLPDKLALWTADGVFANNPQAFPNVVGWNFIKPVNQLDGKMDPTFAACLKLNGLID